MRVAHFIASLDAAAGGPPVVCARLAGALATRGHAVTVVTGDSPTPVAVGAGVGVAAGVRVGWRDLVMAGPGRRRLAELVRGAGVLHLHGVWEPLLLAAAAEARRARVPYVVAPHGMLDPWSLAQKRLKKRLALALAVRRALDGAAALHLLNRDEAELLRPLGLAAPAAVVPNGVDLAEVAAGPPAADAPYLLFLSRLHFKKGLDILADAFALLAPRRPGVRLVVAGGDGGARADFEARVRASGLSERVSLVGPLYGAAKWGALAHAACFCLPSRQEGFSVAILEALACRAPVVVSENCHFPEVAEAGAGLVVPLDAGKVADALDAVLGDPSAAAAMGAAGRRLVEGRYTWDKVAEACERMYAAAGAAP